MNDTTPNKKSAFLAMPKAFVNLFSEAAEEIGFDDFMQFWRAAFLLEALIANSVKHSAEKPLSRFGLRFLAKQDLLTSRRFIDPALVKSPLKTLRNCLDNSKSASTSRYAIPSITFGLKLKDMKNPSNLNRLNSALKEFQFHAWTANLCEPTRREVEKIFSDRRWAAIDKAFYDAIRAGVCDIPVSPIGSMLQVIIDVSLEQMQRKFARTTAPVAETHPEDAPDDPLTKSQKREIFWEIITEKLARDLKNLRINELRSGDPLQYRTETLTYLLSADAKERKAAPPPIRRLLYFGKGCENIFRARLKEMYDKGVWIKHQRSSYAIHLLKLIEELKAERGRVEADILKKLLTKAEMENSPVTEDRRTVLVRIQPPDIPDYDAIMKNQYEPEDQWEPTPNKELRDEWSVPSEPVEKSQDDNELLEKYYRFEKRIIQQTDRPFAGQILRMWFRGRSEREIADELGIGRQVVRTTKDYLRGGLQQALTEEGLTASDCEYILYKILEDSLTQRRNDRQCNK